MKPFEITESKSALKNYAIAHTIEGRDGYDERSFFLMERYEVRSGKIITANQAFHSNPMVNLKGSDIDELYSEMAHVISGKITKFRRTGSNWYLRSVVKLENHMVEYKPLKGNSYIPLPAALVGKRAIINMKNETDNECFKWAVTRALNPKDKNTQRIDNNLRERANDLNWNGIEFPVSLASIGKFEKQKETISVNVLGYERNVIHPLRISDYDRQNEVNLLLIAQGENQHYCLIKDISRLLCNQTTTGHRKRYYCLRCLNGFDSVDSLNRHKEYCQKHNPVKVVLPEESTTIKFRNHARSMRVPFVIYADFEAFTELLDTCQPNPDYSYVNQYQKHTPCSFCYLIKSIDDNIYPPNLKTYVASLKKKTLRRYFSTGLKTT